MLKREGHRVLHSFERYGERVPLEALADDNLDTPNLVSGDPVALVLKLSAVAGET